ncbi:MAG: flotillin-like FloA family protein [Planctomycetes bacterium]|nr:flotillin-like FloA family protein [Planctomycetota bacterium]
MNGNEVVLAVAALAAAVWVVGLVFFFVHVRLWVLARLSDAPVSALDIVRMRLRGCPPRLVVHAMIALRQRGVTVTAQEAEGLYLAAAVRGERVGTAAEFARLLENVRRHAPDESRS